MIRIVQIGVGALGRRIVQSVRQYKDIKIVAAVDRDPAKIGKDLGVICALKPMGIKISGDLEAGLKMRKADVAVITTVSALKDAVVQIHAAAEAGLHVVSTCEELAFPWRTHPRIAKRIERVCWAHLVTCLGTGVNPGFLMDYLPGVLSTLCRRVTRIRVTRVQNASKRRASFQEKIGAGLSLQAFRKSAGKGRLRHVGLTESMHMIAAMLGWRLARTRESLKPVTAAKTMRAGRAQIKKGRVRGVEQIGYGYRGGKEVIRLHFRAALGEKKPEDIVEITGDPGMRSVLPGGVDGDAATVAATINAVKAVKRMEPGLKTMLDVPPLGCRYA
jgi:4-hydroxy-tetrahydrodipicolinate reductase